MWVDGSRAAQWHLAAAAWLIRQDMGGEPSPALSLSCSTHSLFLCCSAPLTRFWEPTWLVSGLGSLSSCKEGIWKEGAAVMHETLVLQQGRGGKRRMFRCSPVMFVLLQHVAGTVPHVETPAAALSKPVLALGSNSLWPVRGLQEALLPIVALLLQPNFNLITL